MSWLDQIPNKEECTCSKCAIEQRDLKIKQLEEDLHRLEYLLKQYALRDERPCRVGYYEEIDEWERANQEAGL